MLLCCYTLPDKKSQMKDWEVVSDRIIARLRARCEDTVDLVDVALSHWPACCSIIGSFAPLLSTMGVGAEILRWA